MCTVTFYKNNHNILITSNRDEHINRPIAIAPKKIILGNEIVYCPIDPQSNGTWFAVKQDGSVFVLLNGAEKKHIPKPPYRESRGLILLHLISSRNFHETWRKMNLSNIEPFTVISFIGNELFQIRWDGNNKSLLQLDTKMAHIWSSTTLYSEEIIRKREKWFTEFLIQNQDAITANNLIKFHTNAQNNDLQNGLIINRNNTILTKNITQCIIEKDKFYLNHLDLISNTQSKISDLLL